MGNCDYGAPGSEFFERLLNLHFGLGIERRGSLVEQKNRRVFQDGARNRNPLLLSTGEKAALVADHGLIALGLGHNEIMR